MKTTITIYTPLPVAVAAAKKFCEEAALPEGVSIFLKLPAKSDAVKFIIIEGSDADEVFFAARIFKRWLGPPTNPDSPIVFTIEGDE